MRIYQYDKHPDFHALGCEIKCKREEKGWTQEYLAQLVNRIPRTIMYIENRGQYASFDTFYQLVTLLEISVDQFFFRTSSTERVPAGNRLMSCSTLRTRRN